MNLKCIAALFCMILLVSTASSQERRTKNIILITLDGFRWQELFQGADPDIVAHKKYFKDSAAIGGFWHPSEDARRESLMPFVWNVLATRGQIYGNRDLHNRVNCTNDHLLSYPGYSEMLVGFNHRKVTSNKKIENPNATVLEAIQKTRRFEDKVAAFATWDAFPYILRETRSDIYVNAGQDLAMGDISDHERNLNAVLAETQVRSDSLTFQYAMEYLKRERPRVTFIGFDGTDHHAHAGRYDEYLKAAHNADKMIADLWRWIQSQDDYRDQTTLFITTDHGRGNGRNNWRKHRLLAAGSRHIWFAVMGPDTPAFGEMKIRSRTYQNQVAKTIAAFLGLPYSNAEPVGDVVQTMISVPPVPDPDISTYSSK